MFLALLTTATAYGWQRSEQTVRLRILKCAPRGLLEHPAPGGKQSLKLELIVFVFTQLLICEILEVRHCFSFAQLFY